MNNLTPEGLRILEDVARRHGVSLDAAISLLGALAAGNGTQAQFNHPDLGGMGQWSQGGMIMVGDMFNQGLKYRVDALCNELAGLLRGQPLFNVEAGAFQSQNQSSGGGVSLFVGDRARPANGGRRSSAVPPPPAPRMICATPVFPGARRLAIQQGGQVRVYDTGEHRISGFSQQQGGDQSLTFTSQFGLVRVADLPLVSPTGERPRENPAPAVAVARPPTPAAVARAPTPAPAANDVLTTLERLAELRRKDILTEEEFSAKKAELLSRL